MLWFQKKKKSDMESRNVSSNGTFFALPFLGGLFWCDVPAVPVDCIGQWRNATQQAAACSVSCGVGTASQTYRILSPALNGGAACEASDGDVRSIVCTMAACRINAGKKMRSNDRVYDCPSSTSPLP